MKLIDIGVNLLDPMFRGIYRGKSAHPDDLMQVIKRATQAGCEKMIITTGSLEEAQEAQSFLDLLSKEDPQIQSGLYTTVGVHPTRAQEFVKNPDEYLASLQRVARHPKVVAIGECGLDYDRLEFCPKDIQKKYFARQFELAQETQLPLFLHNRNSAADFIQIVKEHRKSFTTGVVHSFDGTWEEARSMIQDLDLYIGINGCSLRTAQNLDTVKKIPLDRLMIETDAPWCDIRPTHPSFELIKDYTEKEPWEIKKKEKFVSGCRVKGRNEPCTLPQVLHVIAKLKDMDAEQVAQQVYSNTCKVFFP